MCQRSLSWGRQNKANGCPWGTTIKCSVRVTLNALAATAEHAPEATLLACGLSNQKRPSYPSCLFLKKTDPLIDYHRKGQFADTSLDPVRGYIKHDDTVVYHPGAIPESFNGLEKARIAFSHVDVDIKQSAFDCCEFIFPRLSVAESWCSMTMGSLRVQVPDKRRMSILPAGKPFRLSCRRAKPSFLNQNSQRSTINTVWLVSGCVFRFRR